MMRTTVACLLIFSTSLLVSARADLGVKQTLTAGAEAEDNSEFGRCTSADGSWLFVGQPSSTNGGNVHVFKRQANGSWGRTQVLSIAVSGNHAVDSRFGIAIELSDTTAVIGAMFSGDDRAGRVYIYELVGADWQLSQTLARPVGDFGFRANDENFGRSLALDGDRLLIGVPQSDAGRGSVWIARRGLDGLWAIRPLDDPMFERLQPNGGHPSLLFGVSIDLVGPYSLETGRPEGGEPDEHNSGIFPGGDGMDIPDRFSYLIPDVASPNGPIIPAAPLVAPATLQLASLVQMLSEAQGVAAFRTFGPDYGAPLGSRIIPLTRTNRTWSYGTPTEFPAVSFFTAMAVSGTRLLVGASSERFVVLMTLTNGAWTPTATIPAPASAVADGFGAATAFSGDEYVVGATGVANQGAVYVFAEQSTPPESTTPTTPTTPDSGATLRAKGKRKIKTSRQRIFLRGSTMNAERVEFQSGKGGFKRVKGSLSNWKVRVRLTKKRTVVRVRAAGSNGEWSMIRFVIERETGRR